MVLATLADVRTLMQHLPADRREQQTWRQVAADIEAAAAGGDIEGAAIALRMVTVFRARRMPAAVMAFLGLLCRDEARCKDRPTAHNTFRVTLLLFGL